jgi:hypothetical protein
MIVLLSLAAASTASASIIAGPVQWNGHDYYLLSQNNWTASEAQAVTMGGHLVTINDAAENQFVVQTFSDYGGIERELWIGLTDQNFPGPFVWSSGEPVTYTNWNPGEPDDFLGLEYWTLIHRPSHEYASQWNDFKNTSADDTGVPFFGVVEVVPEPTTCWILVVALPYWRRRLTRDRSDMGGN